MIRGYKGFNPDMTCQGFRYEAGKTYTADSEVIPCEQGFHFCRKMADVFDYYDEKNCRYAEVEALGEVVDEGNKSVTNKLRIVRELTWPEVFEVMYTQEGIEFKDSPFPANEIINARETGTLDGMLPSGTEFPVRFSNGEHNVLVVCRDKDHTYVVTKHLMAKKFVMNREWTNTGGWPGCEMRKHVHEIYAMLPEDVRKVIIPMNIRQFVQGKLVECENPAFLLSVVNVFGKNRWLPDDGSGDSQIDIFQKPAGRAKRLLGASSASWWWLRSAYSSGSFSGVTNGGSSNYTYAHNEGGVVVGFCIETRP